MSRIVGVAPLPSFTKKPHRARCQFSTEKPIFDVFGSSENWDSVVNTRPTATPYPPPTSLPSPFHTSNECT
jgi:hypothetical protein